MERAQYRADIDGLRAIAVSLVLLFHAGFQPLGGFIGVDVFFVISGYLITGIILAEARADRFSLLNFYDRRVRRIVPALLVVLVAVLIAGGLTLLPGTFAVLGESAAAAAVGIANFFFFRNTGYFDGAAELMPLLHTWSLAVEEQFYVVWPLLLVGAVKLSRRWPGAVEAMVGLIIAASLALAIVKVGQGAKSAFYQPFGRAWELAAGGALVLMQDRLRAMPRLFAEALKLAGLAAIFIPAFLLTSKSPFPGANAILPVLGAAVLLMPTSAPTFAGRLLALPPLPFIGKISYSLYLWHWPVIVFTRHYFNGAPLTTTQAVAALGVSFILAVLSWRFIEQPFRRPRASPGRTVLAGGLAGGLVAALGLGVSVTGGLPGRVSPDMADMGTFEQVWNWSCSDRVSLDTGMNRNLCVAGVPWEEAKVRAIIWGDSHAEHFMHLLDVAGRETGTAIALVRSCPAVFSEHGLKRRPVGLPPVCAGIYDAVSAALKAQPDIKLVILSSAWNVFPRDVYRTDADPADPAHGLALMETEFLRIADDLAAPGRKFLLLGDVPRWHLDPIPCLAAQSGLALRAACARDMQRMSRADMHDAKMQDAVNDLFRSLDGRREDIFVGVPADALCDDEGCAARENGEFLYFDTDHLRRNITPESRESLSRKLGLTDLLRRAEDAP